MHLSGRNIERPLISPLFDLVKVRGEGQIFQNGDFPKTTAMYFIYEMLQIGTYTLINVPKKLIF